MRKSYKIMVGKPEGKRDHSEDLDVGGSFRMDLGEIGWEGVNWIHLAQDRVQWRAVVKTVMNLWVP
jgi:hypothetical protein